MSPAEPLAPRSRIPSFDEAYGEYVPVFLRALGHLSRLGFPLAPDEGMDVIHDFFVEAWPGLRERYQSEKGTFSAYVGVAFARFARKRIMRMKGWRGRLHDLREIAQVATADKHDPADRLQAQESVASVQAAIRRLSSFESTVLRDFLTTGASERTLAVRHGITRHRLRELLVTSLGQVAGEVLASHEDQITSEWNISSKLWIDGRSDRDIALRLQIPPAEVRQARRHSVEQLLRALRGQVPVAAREGTNMGNEWTNLLRETLLSEGNEALLAKVQQHRHDIQTALSHGECQEFSEEEARRIGRSHQWLGRVYQALGAMEEPTGGDGADCEIYSMLEQEREDVYIAFDEALLPGLSAEYTNWSERFADAPPISPEVAEILRSEQARPFEGDEELLRVGITPIVIFEACEGIRLLLDRIPTLASWPADNWPVSGPLTKVLSAYQRSRGARAAAFVLARSESQANVADGVFIPWTLLVEELQTTPDCPSKAAADALARWIIDVLRVRPLLIPAYCAEPSGQYGISLTREDGDAQAAVPDRWSEPVSYPCTVASAGIADYSP